MTYTQSITIQNFEQTLDVDYDIEETKDDVKIEIHDVTVEGVSILALLGCLMYDQKTDALESIQEKMKEVLFERGDLKQRNNGAFYIPENSEV